MFKILFWWIEYSILILINKMKTFFYSNILQYFSKFQFYVLSSVQTLHKLFNTGTYLEDDLFSPDAECISTVST